MTIGDTMCPESMLTLDANRITIGCEFDYGADEVKVVYEFVAEQYISFTLSGVDAPETVKWSVWMDDQQTAAWTRSGSTISLRSPVSPKSKIKIVAERGGT